MIVTCGEAIVDLVPEAGPDGGVLFRPTLGGSLFNVALGVARLGGRAGFLWELSTDQFGTLFAEALAEAGVDRRLLRTSDRLTPVAVVDLSGPEPRYTIADPGRLMATFDPAGAEGALAAADCFHTGSAILALDPLGARLEALASGVAADTVVSIDFNVRPPSVSDAHAYRARLAAFEEIATIVKASDADLAFLHGEAPPEAHLDRWLSAGAALGVVTLGPGGAIAATPAGRVRLPSPARDVVDVVGAGDAFMAGLLSWSQRNGVLSRARLASLGADGLRDALAFAQAAAASCCRHRGCRMPFAHEIAETAA